MLSHVSLNFLIRRSGFHFLQLYPAIIQPKDRSSYPKNANVRDLIRITLKL